jgi:protease-4
MEKLGVERRLYTSGVNKAFLDPFSEEKDSDVQFWNSVLNKTHEQFIAKVKEGRGDRLHIDEDTFSGLIWNGEQALEKGFIDGLGSSGYVAREIVGAAEIVDFTPQPDPFERFTKTLGVAAGNAMASVLNIGGLSMR